MSKEIEQIAEKVTPIFKKYGVIRAGVFGSYARGEQKPDSDVDFLVEYPKGASLYDVFDIREEVEKALDKEVDLVSEKAIVPYFKESIYRDLKPIYA